MCHLLHQLLADVLTNEFSDRIIIATAVDGRSFFVFENELVFVSPPIQLTNIGGGSRGAPGARAPNVYQ